MMDILTSSELVLIGGSAAFSIYSMIKAKRSEGTVRKLREQMGVMQKSMDKLLWEDQQPYIKHSYSTNKAREHCFEVEVTNILPEPITLAEVFCFPPEGKISFAEISFPQEKNQDGMMRVDRINYADKMTIEKAKTPAGIVIAPNSKCLFRYTVKFKDAVLLSRRPDIFINYYSERYPDTRDVKIAENTADTLHVFNPARNKHPMPLSSAKMRLV